MHDPIADPWGPPTPIGRGERWPQRVNLHLAEGVLFHFHTRTKTGRTPELQSAAPGPWVELSPGDASERGIAEGDLVEVRSRRGLLRAPARISGVRPRTVFIPFRYGYWDTDEPDGRPGRAANELTLTAWDPVSKQPLFKAGAVSVTRVAAGAGPAPAPAPVQGAAAPSSPETGPAPSPPCPS